MLETKVALPSKPRIVTEDGNSGTFEIDGLYPGYGHTLGNSLRRIILSSLPGAAITQVKITGADHEFAVLDGIREDVLTILLNLKRVRFLMHSDEPMTVTLSAKKAGVVTAGDIEVPSQVTVLNPEQPIAEITGKATLQIEITIEHGLGYVPRELHQKEKVGVGMIALDAIFTPIRRVNYEVENMRVGDRTDFNRLRVHIETDGTMSPREALEQSIEVMIHQLKSIIGFKDSALESVTEPHASEVQEAAIDPEVLKNRIETLDISARTMRALEEASIRTVGGLARKSADDILAIEGIGMKGLEEIEEVLTNFGVSLKA